MAISISMAKINMNFESKNNFNRKKRIQFSKLQNYLIRIEILIAIEIDIAIVIAF